MQDEQDERKALLYGLGAVLAWSTVATGFKLGLAVLAPAQLLFAGACVSAVIFSAAAARQGWPRRHLNLSEGVLFGLMNPVLYYLVLFEAYARLPAQIAQPLNYTWAIMLAILAVPVLGQRLSARMVGGIAVGYLGVLVLLSQGRFDTLPAVDWLGVLLATVSTVVWAGYWLASVRSATEPTALMATSFCLAVPVLGVICAAGPGLPALTGHTLLYGAWVGLIEMGVTFLLWARALKLTAHAARIGQHLTSWLGLGIIVVGLLVTGRPRTSPQPDN